VSPVIDPHGAAELVVPGVIAVIAGAVASVAGFGIGSLLTPALVPIVGTRAAVVTVALPHAAGTALRLWRLRASIDWALLRGFGMASAAGGLVGAAGNAWLSGVVLGRVFGALLVLSGLAGFAGWTRRVHLRNWAALVAGFLAGIFGGLVGNQGSIRSAALLTFRLTPIQFVATATATALMVDAARVPVYLATAGIEYVRRPALTVVLTLGVLAGTIAGEPILRLVPEPIFRRSVSLLLLGLGCYMLLRPATGL
jgi:hypothetical protein